ncbi:MAG: exodeoxyribonuclease VII small subunit [Chloroflexi bacterium]|nr:exodeoxyribonuclease VII small subunit [Chloroflexota bacterium]MDA1239543.1 exodeoxyribonuclease VII small subunit [Chloroflexota bacterium]MQC25503.1 exodeoxyribonuclease VII small subunit [Chloroflexota bacterium]MQC48194.1 exodeoxyribonuclease VII small subunit [Chloroflexota bacterium]
MNPRAIRSDAAATDQPALDLAEAAAETFEVVYGRLEVVAQQLEAGGLTLEQSVALYEEGMRLAERCQALLGDVEQRIETLRQRANGDPA